MANLFEKKDRHVLPTWRSFENTSKLGELNGSKNIQFDSTFKPDISDLLDDWADHPTIAIAGDVLGAALVGNHHADVTVRSISNFILENKNLAPKAVINAAESILRPREESIVLSLDIPTTDVTELQDGLSSIYVKINAIKKELIKNPYNSISWIEIARLYSILGQDKKAIRAIENGISISRTNRFVLRSAARFFVHIGDIERAHDLIRKSIHVRHDPWILATEISIAQLRNRNSVFAKEGLRLVGQATFHPFNTTELASTLASLELKHDNIKSSKKLFHNSLVSPNDNSLAQAEWASNIEKNLLSVVPKQFSLDHSFEALARDFSEHKEWQQSIEYSKKWFLDQPFSKSAVLFGNEVASVKLKDHAQAVQVASLGLISHPNDAHLLNNIIYSLCMQNKIGEAQHHLSKVRREDMNAKDINGVCLTATRGLLCFRQGYGDIGRSLYAEAIELSKKLNLTNANTSASVNYVREELLLGQVDVSEYIPKLEKVMKFAELEELRDEAAEVIDMYKRKVLKE